MYALLGILIIATVPAAIYLFRYIISKASQTENPSRVALYAKKYDSADIQKYGLVLTNTGLVISLLLTIWAFSFKIYEDPPVIIETPIFTEEVMSVPVTTVVPPPPKPVVKAPEIREVEKAPEEEVEVKIEEKQEEEVTYGPPSDAPAGPPGPPIARPEPVEEEVFMVVEEQPSPVGGMPAFMQYLYKNIKYPDQARRLGVEGKVFVEFVVDKDGSLTDIKVMKGIGAGCDEEAVRVLKNAPKWNPGKQRGRPVKVKMVLPIQFRLA